MPKSKNENKIVENYLKISEIFSEVYNNINIPKKF